jgi:hypothetical protein
MAGTSEAAGEQAVLRDGAEVRGQLVAPVVARATSWAAALPWALPLFAAALGVAARVWLVSRTHAMIDADEAMVGIQAERILHGQYPIYFYGQAYMGSLEAYLVAPLVALLGPSGWALRLVPIALSALLVFLTWRLACALLPASAPTTPLLAGLAALVAAVPPLYDAVAEMRAWGGQIEVYVVTLALLLGVVRLADRLRAGAGAVELAWRWLVLGVVAGLGIWINPLISYGLVAAVLWLIPPLAARGAPGLTAAIARRAHVPSSAARGGWAPSALLAALALLPGLALGGLPAWIYAAQHRADNLLIYVVQPAIDPAASGAARHGRLFLGAAITFRYVTCVAPHVLDGGLPTEARVLLPLRLLLLLAPVVALGCAAWLLLRRKPAPLRVGLPLLYAGVVTAIFCLGTSAWAETRSDGCAADLAGRYAVPLVLVEPLLLLALFALPAALMAWRARGSFATPASSAGESARQDGIASRPRRDGERTSLAARGFSAIVALLLVAGALQASTYAMASPTQTFQSPYYRRIAADDSQLLAYLKAHDIHAAWCNHWIGNIVTYRTDGGTICADYYDQVYNHGIQRPPGTLETVSAASRASFILILTDLHPCLARELDAQRIPYSLAVLPASGVTVITPQRTVDPASVIRGLGQDYTDQNLQGSDCSNAPISSLPTSTLSSSSNSRVSPGPMNSSRPF